MLSPQLDENAKLNDCYRDKKDWRLCKDEVSRSVESPTAVDFENGRMPGCVGEISVLSTADSVSADGGVQAVLEAARQ